MAKYSKNKKYQVVDFINMAQKGDLILNERIKHIVYNNYTYNKNVSILKAGEIYSYMKSNEFISKFEIPKFSIKGLVNNRARRGDFVEAYIYFLHQNYGTEAVDRFLIKNIKIAVLKFDNFHNI